MWNEKLVVCHYSKNNGMGGGWKHNQLNIKNNPWSCNHIFTQMQESGIETILVIAKPLCHFKLSF